MFTGQSCLFAGWWWEADALSRRLFCLKNSWKMRNPAGWSTWYFWTEISGWALRFRSMLLHSALGECRWIPEKPNTSGCLVWLLPHALYVRHIIGGNHCEHSTVASSKCCRILLWDEQPEASFSYQISVEIRIVFTCCWKGGSRTIASRTYTFIFPFLEHQLTSR